MTCRFDIYNWSSDDPIITMPAVPCFEDSRRRWKVTLFDTVPGVNLIAPMWRHFVKIDRNKIRGVLWEFQLVLTEIGYTVCGPGGEENFERFAWVSNNRVCAMNFAVSDTYLVHAWSSLSTSVNTDLWAFRYLNEQKVVSESELDEISGSRFWVLNNGELARRIETFVNNYSILAILKGRYLDAYTLEVLNKVVNTDIYFYDGWDFRTPLEISGGDMDRTEWFTIVVRNADLVIQWSLYGNGMYIVPDGEIIFEPLSCDVKDTVQWIFVTDKWFRSARIRNDNLQSLDWCADGRLAIEWVMIGPNTDGADFVPARRAVLESWFNVENSSQQQKVFDGASVLIRTAAKFWTNLPPWAWRFDDIIWVFR